MVKHLVKLINKIVRVSSESSTINHRLFSSKITFDNVYSNENLTKCLISLDGLNYHNSSEEERKKFFEIKKKDVKKAAVLVPFCYDVNQEPSILFTLRSHNLTIHKWEVSFPGGKLCDKQDNGDITKTAARETKEELGISDDSIEIIGVINPIPGKQSNVLIYPVLAKIDLEKEGDHNIEFHNKCLAEVEEVIIRPLSELVKSENWHFTHWTTGLTTPLYRDSVFNDLNRPRIWGLSSYILFRVLSNLVPDHFKLEYFTLTRYKS